ncbi:MAG: enoyl-CoA hydratase/isomerase family protein [Alphaproteobacteria bacterium]|nr:enoyl-CoA hydratase/isomerase family protein [Alphaproteobacteria bacterium]
MAQFARLGVEDGVATLTLDAPPVNAIDLPVTEHVGAALKSLVGRAGVIGLVVTGAGRAFSAGVNFKVVPGYDLGQKRAMVRNINGIIATLYALPWPVVAAVNGPANGGGMVLALACDVRLASETAHFALGEVTAGIPFPAGPLVVLEDALDAPARRDLALTGRGVDAAEAQRLRIVDRLVDPATLLAQATATVRQLAAAPGYRTVKAQLRQHAVQRLDAIVASDSDPMLAHWV